MKKLSKKDITVETRHDGSLLLSTILNGSYRKSIYYYFSKQEAIRKFVHYLVEHPV